MIMKFLNVFFESVEVFVVVIVIKLLNFF